MAPLSCIQQGRRACCPGSGGRVADGWSVLIYRAYEKKRRPAWGSGGAALLLPYGNAVSWGEIEALKKRPPWTKGVFDPSL